MKKGKLLLKKKLIKNKTKNSLLIKKTTFFLDGKCYHKAVIIATILYMKKIQLLNVQIAVNKI